jgi:glucose/arabinose dehydrogenase
VASADPVNQKWLEKHPEARDIACKNLRLTGVTFDDPKGKTGAYQALGHADAREIKAEPLCTSSIYRLRPGSTTPELVAWGFRNPVGLAFDANGTLLTGMQGADERSTRPITNDADSVLRVRDGAWYGWPDYGANLAPLSTPPVIDLTGSGLTAPDRANLVAATKPHAAICALAVASDGGVLVAEMGDFKPLTAKDDARAGYQVERIDPGSGGITPYLRNRGTGDAQPASTLDLRNGFERPVDVRIGPDGLIYVLDFGAFIVQGGEPKAFPKTGKLFRIEKR